MKLGNFVLRCAFLQIFIVFALYSYAQLADEDVHKYKMIEAINSGNFEEAAKEIVNVKDWTFNLFSAKDYLDIESGFDFIRYVDSIDLSMYDIDSLELYIVDELYSFIYFFISKQDFKNAIDAFDKILNIQQRVIGKYNLDYIKNIDTLADIYMVVGNYIKAESLYSESLEISKKVLGQEHPDYMWKLNDIAIAYEEMGNYIQAELLYEEALEIYLKIFGEKDADYLVLLDNLANMYLNMGNYAKAELFYKMELDIQKQVYVSDSMEHAITLSDLASVYKGLGNYIQAELLYKEVLKIQKNVLGKENDDYAASLNDLAMLYKTMQNYEQAELLYKEALEIEERVLGKETFDYSVILGNLANLYSDMDNYVEAELFFKETLEIKEKVLGKGHLGYLLTVNDLLLLYFRYNKFDSCKQWEMRFRETLEICKNDLGSEHSDYLTILNNLASLYYDTGNYIQAEPLFIEHSNIIRKHIKTNFEFLSEKERQLYWETQYYHFNIFYLSFYYSYYPQKKSISEFAYNNAILTKGLLLNASTQVQNAILNSGNQELIDLWNELCGLRQQIVFLQNKTLEEQENAGITALEERANELDKQLTASSSEFKQGKEIWDIEWDDVKEKLKPNEVAIEFVNFYYFSHREFDSTMYCALLLRNNSQYPEMITLFEEKDILPYISSKTESNTTNTIYDFYANGEVIKNKIWGNILPKIKEGETVYFSPSGLFHQLAIESLPYDENRKMSDVYNLVRLSSTREIVLNKSNSNQYSTATLYGGIHYDTSAKDLLAESNNYSQETLLTSRGVENDTLDRGSVDYLPGTKKEAEKINKMLVDNNITAQLYTMNQANEESFKNLSNKHQSIIHIGTHGFTWTDSVAKKKDYFAERMQMIGEEQQYRGPIIDPLNRCGLLFAGANIALQGKSRELPEGVQDGILTAKEISLLDLRDCDLVVLSACETAKGDVTSEGVFGLQRAFKMAGVQTIIMSLWKVNDEATQMLMTEFYNNWIVKKQEKREAFKNAQNVVRKEYEEPVYWAGFIMLD